VPVYDYKCAEHGLFYELAPVAEASQPCACPVCGTLSARIIIMAPFMNDMSETNRKAHTQNEKSRHQPVFSSTEVRQEQADRNKHDKHGRGCSCHGDKPIRKSALFYTADGNKMFPSMRPWMISH
jgi:putative FmdB family regulatory protein